MDISAILYASATGFTAKYAALLAQRTRLPFYALEDAAGKVPRGAPVLYLGWLCAGGIKGLKKVQGRFHVRAVCAVGMAPASPGYAAKLAQQNKLGDAPLFYLRGGYAPEKLTGVYRPMMALMGKMVGKAPADNEGDAAMRDSFQGGDWVTPEQLGPVCAWLDGSGA